MAIELSVYANASDNYLHWKTGEIKDCLGFAIECRSDDGKQYYIKNRLGFSDEEVSLGETKPSTDWPFQRYDWTDHRNSPGKKFSYRVVPVIKTGPTTVKADESIASEWSDFVEMTGETSTGKAVYFNRGTLLSQFVARELDGDISVSALKKFKDKLAEDSYEFRQFLGGTLLEVLTEILEEVKADKELQIYAALYELSDDTLIEYLKDIGKRAHVILANGSNKSGDGNTKAAEALNDTAVDLHRRMLKSRGLGHNKFLLIERKGKPVKLLTGSTNWATTGLCTQVNNAIVITNETAEGKEILAEYREQWDHLKDAADSFPAWLKDSNSTVRGARKGNWNLWFTPTQSQEDLDWITHLIEGAKESVHFLMFNPGTTGLLQPVIQAQLDNPDLRVFGVVNQLSMVKTTGSGEDKQTVRVDLVSPEYTRNFPLDVIEPEGVHKELGAWAAEVTRRDFLGPSQKFPTVGHAIVHAKILIIDGLSDAPIVITGSHNFSMSASKSNDENLLIIKNDRELAQKYLVAINSVYQHYRWRAYLMEHNSVTSGLSRNPNWQKRKLTKAELANMDYWVQPTKNLVPA